MNNAQSPDAARLERLAEALSRLTWAPLDTSLDQFNELVRVVRRGAALVQAADASKEP